MTTSPERSVRPGLRFVLSHPAHAIAFGFGAGLVRPAPGTAGTLLALPIFWFVYPRVPDWGFLALVALLLALGSWACARTGRALGAHDHGGMVIDEIVAFLLVLFMLPREPLWEAFGFLLFRLFDILKPIPIRYYDRTMKTGFGVMFDDLIAAFYTLLVLSAWKAVA